MSRVGRVYYNNAVYHVSIRGNNRQAVLKKAEDKASFLRTLSKFKERFRFKLFGFVIMDNHAHLVIGSNDSANISKIMQAVTLSYSKKFRHKYNYTGYVWQGRFKSNVIESDSYVFSCLGYIHNNPLRAEMVDNIEDYIWSSYHFYNGATNGIDELIQIDKLEY